MKKFDFKIRGNSYHTEVLEFENNTAKIEVNGTVYVVELEKEINLPKTPTIIRKRPKIENKKIEKSDATASKIKAPLPGNILEIKVSIGDKVEKGQIVLIMEAMKMENNILSETSGTVKNINVSTGDSVLQDDVLIEIE